MTGNLNAGAPQTNCEPRPSSYRLVWPFSDKSSPDILICIKDVTRHLLRYDVNDVLIFEERRLCEFLILMIVPVAFSVAVNRAVTRGALKHITECGKILLDCFIACTTPDSRFSDKPVDQYSISSQ